MALTIMERTKSVANGRPDDSASEPLANLRELTSIVLRRAVYTVSKGYSIDSKLRESMRRVCHLAQKRAVTAEGLVVMMKNAWWEIPESERAVGSRREEILSRVITFCINEYFEPRKE